MTQQTKIVGGVHVEQRHDSAHKHVTGQADYIDDMAAPRSAGGRVASRADLVFDDILDPA